MGEIFSTELEEDFGAVFFFIHFHHEKEHAVNVGYAAYPAMLVAIDHARTALNEHIPEHHGRVVAVGRLARDPVGLSTGHREGEDGQHEHQPDLAHGFGRWLELIKP